MSSRILVTGASGFVGRQLTETLAASGREVRAAFRANVPLTTGPEYESIKVASLAGDTDWQAALDGVGAVVHLAARVHVMQEEVRDPLADFRRVNVEGTLNLARQALSAGVKRFVFVSSIKVNGECTLAGHAFTEADAPDPQDAYGRSKHEAELGLTELCADTGMELTIIRPPLVYGPDVKANFAALLKLVQRGWPLPLGSVRNRRSLVALDNLVDFIITCIFHPQAANQTFLVSDGYDLSITELVCGIAHAAGVPARLVPVPVWILKRVAALVGKGDVMQRLCENLQVNISKAHDLLGWVPQISVENGLQRVVSEMRKR